MTWWTFAVYVVFGIGTAREVMGRLIANDVHEYTKNLVHPNDAVEDGIDHSWRTYGPLNLVLAWLALMFWPLLWAWVLILRPVGTIVGPLLVTWWRAPVNRQLKKRGLT